MAFRVEIGEDVESAIGLNITGAAVEVRFHGGAQAPVYNAENGGALVTQPLSTVNGKIGADYPSGAWVAEGDYDLLVTFGGDTLTYFWSAVRGDQFVTTLPAGAGTSAPEDGEKAIELYDAVNGGAWLRRYRAAATQWDMIGGPPPAAASLPGTPRTRQEIYLTGGTPAVQHLRYNGATWDYVGTPPTTPVTNSPFAVLDVGQIGQKRMGRQLAASDFTDLGLSAPIGLWNLSDTSDVSGNNRTLVNKGAVPFTTGIEGQASSAARFSSQTTQALYISTASSAADELALRIRTGSWGIWIKTGKRGTNHRALSKLGAAAGQHCYDVSIGGGGSTNFPTASVTVDGTNFSTVTGTTDVCDNRWHFLVVTHDGTHLKLYVDGFQESQIYVGAPLFAGSAPFNIGGFGADVGTATGNPFTGPLDEGFVTADILQPEHIRALMAIKIPHGYAQAPTRAFATVKRRRRTGALVAADFPSQPLRLHNFAGGALTDQGSNNVPVVNAGTAPVPVAGVDGSASGAYHLGAAATSHWMASDTGLPSGAAARSYGLWVKPNTGLPAAQATLLGWGTPPSNDQCIFISAANGLPTLQTGATFIGGTTIVVTDGLWHFIVGVEDPAAADGVLRKLYVDTRLTSSDATALGSITLGGANRFRIGARSDGTLPSPSQYEFGATFVMNGALTQEQIAKLYQKTSPIAMPHSPFPEGYLIEYMDATNLYVVADGLESQNEFALAVAA